MIDEFLEGLRRRKAAPAASQPPRRHPWGKPAASQHSPAPGASFVQALQKRAKAQPTRKTETMRIVELPRNGVADVPDYTQQLKTPNGSVTLRTVQNQALHAVKTYGGLLGVIGVGHGKSLVALLSGAVMGADMAIVLAPASTVGQLRRTLAEMRAHFAIPPTHVLSYDLLSRPEGTRLLGERLVGIPDDRVVLVADEAHRLKRYEAARTKRVVRFLKAHPGIRFIALSGTMTSKSIHDFAHLAEMALGDNSPVPRDRAHLDAWSQCLDVDGRPNSAHWQTFSPLFERYAGKSPFTVHGEARTAAARRAFRTRLETAPGVVTTTEGSIGCSLRLRALTTLVPDVVQTALDTAQTLGEDPGGEVLEDDISLWRTKRHLSQGFYYRWVWPDGTADREWLDARRAWGRYVRAELQENACEGYDSPFLVAAKVDREARSGKRSALHITWRDWCAQKDKPAPPTEPVWLSKFLVDHALSWLRKQKRPVILWYDSLAMEQALQAEGLTVYSAGMEAPNRPETCAMSIQAHGVGKNLQSWDTSCILSPPSGGKTWEQLLGRLHRQGQTADEVEFFVYQHTEAFQDALVNAIGDARYIEDTTGNHQKLCYADYEGFGF